MKVTHFVPWNMFVNENESGSAEGNSNFRVQVVVKKKKKKRLMPTTRLAHSKFYNPDAQGAAQNSADPSSSLSSAFEYSSLGKFGALDSSFRATAASYTGETEAANPVPLFSLTEPSAKFDSADWCASEDVGDNVTVFESRFQSNYWYRLYFDDNEDDDPEMPEFYKSLDFGNFPDSPCSDDVSDSNRSNCASLVSSSPSNLSDAEEQLKENNDAFADNKIEEVSSFFPHFVSMKYASHFVYTNSQPLTNSQPG